MEITTDDELSYEVESILDSRIRRNKLQYLVRWTGYNDCTWEPELNLDGCKDLIDEFHELHPVAPRSTELAPSKRGEVMSENIK